MPSQVEATTSAVKELSQRTIRTILAKLDASKDVIIRRLTRRNKLKKSSQTIVQQQQHQRQQEQLQRQREEREMIQRLIMRNKVLYEIRLDIYEMKCAALKMMGETNLIPKKPKFLPLTPGSVADGSALLKVNNIKNRMVSFSSVPRQEKGGVFENDDRFHLSDDTESIESSMTNTEHVEGN